MDIKAKAKFIKISPRKVRLVVGVVRGLDTVKALNQLKFINKKAGLPVAKLIESGIANAEHNYELDKNNLYIKEIAVDEGFKFKRWMPKAHGRATPLRKRTSHIRLTLSEIQDSGKKDPKKQKIEDPIKLGDEIKKAGLDKTEKPKPNKKEKNKANTNEEKEIIDPRMEGRGGHTKIEGKNEKGFTEKIFRRKSG